jgi:hypothetical protein
MTDLIPQARADRRRAVDDYDVISAEGPYHEVHAAPKDANWMWSLAYGQHKDRTPRADARRAVMPGARQELAKGVTPQGPAMGLCPRGRSERWDSPNTE